MDMTIELHHFPAVGETLLAERLQTIPGGKGANQACALGKLGGDVGMLGAVGDDEFGRQLLGNLEKANVDVSGIVTKAGENSGRAVIYVDRNGDNNIVVVQGTNALLNVDDIRGCSEKIEACDIVLLQMEIPLETIDYVIRAAAQAGKMVILDPAPAIGNFPKELYRYIDIIKPNETELGILLGDANAVDNIEAAARQLREYGVKNVVVTLGDKGAYVDGVECGPVLVPAYNVVPVDTTAAGDSFISAMAVKLAGGANLMESVDYANLVSAIVVTRKGAQSSIPTKDEVDSTVLPKGE